MLTLRDYQRETVEGLYSRWSGGQVRRIAAVLPTGAGKTVVFSRMAADVAAAGKRTVVLAHRDELLDQAAGKLHDASGGTLRVGRVQARDVRLHGQDAVVASVASLAGKRGAARLGQLVRYRPSLVVVDECHHAVAASYLEILDALGCMGEAGEGAETLTAGFTATLLRGDKVSLGEVWQEAIRPLDVIDAIRRGYLCTARGIRVRVDGLDLRRVARSAGDWRGRALADAMSECLAPAAIARAVVEHLDDRQMIVFTPAVSMAYEVAEALEAAGVSAVALEGTTDREARRLALKRYRAGEIRALVNCGLFTEGTDLPMTSAVVIARPTSSAPLYVQMAGRGLRPWPGKRDCIVMDVVGVTGKHRIASLLDLTGGERAAALSAAERDRMLAEADELGLDLLGLHEAAERPGGAVGIEGRDGALVVEHVDLFEASHQAWLRTKRGIWFLSAGDEVIALAPAGERWDVMCVPASRAGGRWVARDLDLSYAMSWGEEAVYRIEAAGLGFRTGKKAGWRREKITEKQIDMLARLRVPYDGTWSRSDASDAISVELASRRLDHLPIFAGVGA